MAGRRDSIWQNLEEYAGRAFSRTKGTSCGENSDRLNVVERGKALAAFLRILVEACSIEDLNLCVAKVPTLKLNLLHALLGVVVCKHVKGRYSTSKPSCK
jgi:hypothetical protein